MLLILLTASDYALEETAREYVNSVHIQDAPVDKYSLPEDQEQEDSEEDESEEDNLAEETPVLSQKVVNTMQEPPEVAVEEPVGEPQKKTYASIVCISLSLTFLFHFICVSEGSFFQRLVLTLAPKKEEKRKKVKVVL